MTGSLLAVSAATRFTGNSVRNVDILRRPLLIKRMPNLQEAWQEARGYSTLRGRFPLPRLYARLRLPASSLLIYERWGSPTRPKVLLDLFNQADDAALRDYMDVLTTTYREVIFSTASRTAPRQLVGKLYHDRAAPGGRLDAYYQGRTFDVAGMPIDDLADYTLIVNGRERRIDWRATLAWLGTWAADPTPQWSAITQGDPTDVNLAVPFAVFDYDTAGRNALCGEFANFSWYSAFLGGYLVPRYNPGAFKASPETFALMPTNSPRLNSFTAHEDKRQLAVDLTWQPSRARLSANHFYWRKVVEPVWSRLAGDKDINRAIQPYLALRILGVYNIADLEPTDRLALIVCLAECLSEDFDARRFFTEGLT